MAGLALLGMSTPSFAHEEHCHKKNASGVSEDIPSAKTKKACKAAGGEWKHHHEHCSKDENGKKTDLDGVTSEKDCSAKGGTWGDHGHKD